ncbi:MAG: apolipoprotein N-acyltransferase [Planctomycetes bacterium RIFCSPLOWO2_12_FULL_39_13]|nr:MAG: apolipoprotein N-acyltransferase [Planctomycetes bacterium RIFCSPLOWO2_12_FULL_39_13]
MGHSQYLNLPLIQIADITGVYGISFLVVMINAAIADLIERFLVRKKLKLEMYSTITFGKKRIFLFFTITTTCLLLFTALLYGYFGLANCKSLQSGPSVCLVQGNIPQSVKIDHDEKQQEEILMKYINLSQKAIGKETDLIIWPETMAPGFLNVNPKILDREIDWLSKESVHNLANKTHANLLVGGTAIDIDINKKKTSYYNTAFYYNRNGKFVDRYDKIHLVPFGEFIPFEGYFPFLSHLVPYNVSLSNGDRKTIFELNSKNGHKKFRFGVIICYEDSVAPLLRDFRKERVDFMVNITNDAWFCDSSELDQHLAIMVFRAVENRICIVRAANTGISSFVAPDGKIYDYLERDGRYREIDGILCNEIRFMETPNTWYTNHGDMFAFSCIIVTSTLILASITRRILA